MDARRSCWRSRDRLLRWLRRCSEASRWCVDALLPRHRETVNPPPDWRWTQLRLDLNRRRGRIASVCFEKAGARLRNGQLASEGADGIELAPLLRRGYVARERLDRRLDEATVLTVTGPAGSGKTQLLAHWFHKAARDACVSWLTLEPDERRPRLAESIITALQRSAEKPAERRLIAESSVIWFVDNLTQAQLPALRTVAKQLPPCSRLIVAGRSIPALGTALIDGDELAFRTHEAVAYLQARLPNHPARRLADWVTRCDGWPIALNVAADAIERQGEGEAAVIAFDEAVAAALDDLTELLTEEDRRLLAEASLLMPIAPALVGPVTGRSTADAVLGRCTSTVPLLCAAGEVSLRPARYAEPLFARWRAEMPAQRRVALHRRAAVAVQTHDRCQDAVPHLIAAGQMEEAAALLERCLLAVATGGDLDLALQWTKSLPRETILRSDGLRFAAALTFALAGEFEGTAPYFDRISVDERLVMRAVLTTFTDDPDAADALLACVAAPIELPRAMRPIHENLSRWVAYRKTGVLASEGAPPPSLPGNMGPELFHSWCYTACRQADNYLARGRAAQAEAVLVEPLRLAERRVGQHAFPSTMLVTMLAAARLQRGDVVGARTALMARPIPDDEQVADSLIICATVDVRLAAAAEDWKLSLQHLDRFESAASERGLARLEAFCLAERLRTCGHLLGAAAVQDVAARLTRIIQDASRTPVNAPWIRLSALLGCAHAARLGENLGEKQACLKAATAIATQLDRRMALAEILLLQGMPDSDASEEWVAALARLAPADLRALADRLRIRLPDMFRDVLEASEAEAVANVTVVSHVPSSITLTTREHDVLSGLLLNSSNKSIARNLDLSTETVKWHVTNLIKKLDAVDRRQVVYRARALGLTPP